MLEISTSHETPLENADGGSAAVSDGSKAEHGEDDDRNPAANRWPREETMALLKIRSEMDVAFKDANLKAPLCSLLSTVFSSAFLCFSLFHLWVENDIIRYFSPCYSATQLLFYSSPLIELYHQSFCAYHLESFIDAVSLYGCWVLFLLFLIRVFWVSSNFGFLCHFGLSLGLLGFLPFRKLFLVFPFFHLIDFF